MDIFLPSRSAAIFATCACTALAGCGGGGDPPPERLLASMSLGATLGEKIFNDVALSASGKVSCATCHNPGNAHGPADALSVQLGGMGGDNPGFRASPSLRYLQKNPAFFFDGEGTPTGGFNRDGRAQSLQEQAERPFIAAHEMANASKQEVIERLTRAPYAGEFRAVFGAAIFDNAGQAFSRVLFALQQFQKEDPRFQPFDSKYDQYLAGKVKLNEPELRGLALFNDPNKGNCAACHPSARNADGTPPLFTDFTYDNLGVPRNPRIAANGDPAYFDLGLCGPNRPDLVARFDLCGAFKVSTLRNVATRKTFFHNGAFSTLSDVVRFYVRRDTNPEEWYPAGPDGAIQKFNDLPPHFIANVNTTEAPYNRKPGMAPALTEPEIADLVQFLGALTDGYRE